ncbi:metalloregulator ArsR/SmtB family transcription factor [Prosthecobacter sp.]|uniref:ArsR/SmtB family transcription factor n=1 Tax=Prosthecobacter sp. TaxID=1965333 RepID=UPI001E10F5E1|nr:metalloregulator ArsR/SmtB family transcription factor [Prosthecobacter sp.]MCB1278452.1 winged helix-turn-helix transcriptional regulator [Prosthecobacter sp.]
MPRAPKPDLNDAFFALSDPTRRSILEQLGAREAGVTEIAEPHDMSLPAISKHLRVLEQAGLLTRRVEGRQHFLRVNPDPLQQAKQWIERQRVFWEGSFDKLAEHLERMTAESPPSTPKSSKSRKP